MTSTEQEILQSLVELEQAVASMRTSGTKPDLQAIFARIDTLTRELPPEAGPTLRHYLTKRSYEKARLYLQGRDAENAAGNCGHV